MQSLYRGYIRTQNKKSIEPLKVRTEPFKTLEQIKKFPDYAGVMQDDVMFIDIDDYEQSEKLMDIVEHFQLNCRVTCTSRGKHFTFKNTSGLIKKNRTHAQLAVGLEADIKLGSRTSYEVLKVDGVVRHVEWDKEEGQEYDEIPKWLLPVKIKAGFVNMEAGDGRNQLLFNYILTLASHGFSMEESRECIKILNKFVLKEPLDDDELEIVLRDEAFQQPTFYVDGVFQHNVFGQYVMANNHIIKINKQLHIYDNGVYVKDTEDIERLMLNYLDQLKDNQRKETIKYITLKTEDKEISDARYIAFNNGNYDLAEDCLIPFDPNIIITNRIPWNYNPNASSEIVDTTLYNLACGDKELVSLLEECIGYCFYRLNELGKFFILIGDKSNGKSTFLKMIEGVLGSDNRSSLDLIQVTEKFSTAMLFGKLANICADMGDSFIGKDESATLRKIVTGDTLKGEEKGFKPFSFIPYAKLLFSANDIPKMHDPTGALQRRLIIIPFNGKFVEGSPGYDPYIWQKLKQKECMEYLVMLGIKGLQRVLHKNGFTESIKVEAELIQYETDNNPILSFIEDTGTEMIENQPVGEVYKRYQLYCADSGMVPLAKNSFSKQLKNRLGLNAEVKKINSKCIRVYIKMSK